jgi:hypothetical protein
VSDAAPGSSDDGDLIGETHGHEKKKKSEVNRWVGRS